MKKLFFVLVVLLLVFYITACAQKLQEEPDTAMNKQDAASSAKQTIAENNSEFDEIADTNSLDSSAELLDVVE